MTARQKPGSQADRGSHSVLPEHAALTPPPAAVRPSEQAEVYAEALFDGHPAAVLLITEATAGATFVQLAEEFLALGVPEPWRTTFDQWSAERRLSPALRRAVVVKVLCERVFHAVDRGAARAR